MIYKHWRRFYRRKLDLVPEVVPLVQQETRSGNATSTNVELLGVCKHGSGQYQKVFDARKRRLRGLWKRNGTSYGQLTITNQNTGAKGIRRVRLEDSVEFATSTAPRPPLADLVSNSTPPGHISRERISSGLRAILAATLAALV